MPEPEFVEMPESFRVNLYRSSLPMHDIGGTLEEHQFTNDAVLSESESEMALLSDSENESVGRMMDILNRELSGKEKDRMLPIVEYLKNHDKIDAKKMRQITGKTKTTVSRYINRLIELDVLEKEGNSVSVAYKRK